MIFVISDTHFHHSKIIDPTGRPFASVEDMDNTLIANWNRVVRRDDLVCHLGNLALATRARTVQLLKKLNGRIYLIRGNHDIRNLPVAWEGDLHTVRFDGTLFVMCHYPLADWHGRPSGSIMVHGHMHGRPLDPFVPNRVDASVEAIDYTPISLKSVLERCRRYGTKSSSS